MERRPRSRRELRAAALVALVSGASAATAVIVGQAGGNGHGAPVATDRIQAVSPDPPLAAPEPVIRRVYGRGARAVAVVRPATDHPLPGVLFLHGWGYRGPRAYRPWIRHLAREGNAVIVPRYQTSLHSDPARVRAAMLAGVRAALRRTDLVPGTLVAGGHSAGGALAADYAAVASRQGLPRPRAVYVVYPGRAIIGTPGIPQADLRRIAPATRLLVLAGSRDTIVGTEPARALVEATSQIPTSRRRLVVVRGSATSDHLAPLRATTAARRAFWRRFDRLIASARAG